MPLELQFLPASEGDAIWVRWGDDLRHQLLVDMGRGTTGTKIRGRLEELPEQGRHFELLVVTHIDGDHIGGVISGLVDRAPLPGLKFDDIWFNGWPHLHGKRVRRPGETGGLEPMGAVQGELLSDWLTGPWNEHFERGPIARDDPLRTVELSDRLTLTVLGPTQTRLENLQATWADEVELAIEKGRLPESSQLEAMGRSKPVRPELTKRSDLDDLADEFTDPDPSLSNGTSITLLLEWRKRRVLLTGDAFAGDIVEGLALLGEQSPVSIDVFKLPHHGSQANVSDDLVQAVACRDWVFSTNGTRHYHPDATAVARVIRKAGEPRPCLLFNVPSEFNGWWADPTWVKTFDYSTDTGTADGGLTVTLEGKE
jgi:beta-lactamase superfamily II metal-dependent hydrolase